MNSISSYILTIAGVVLISVIVELVMPDGQMNKYIKSVFSFFIVGVIIAPLPNILSNKNLTSVFEVGEYQLQEDYLYALNCSKIEILQGEEEEFLMKQGYKKVKLVFYAKDLYNSELKIDKVKINLKNLIIEQNVEHKDINEFKFYLSQRYTDKFDIGGGSIIYEM